MYRGSLFAHNLPTKIIAKKPRLKIGENFCPIRSRMLSLLELLSTLEFEDFRRLRLTLRAFQKVMNFTFFFPDKSKCINKNGSTKITFHNICQRYGGQLSASRQSRPEACTVKTGFPSFYSFQINMLRIHFFMCCHQPSATSTQNGLDLSTAGIDSQYAERGITRRGITLAILDAVLDGQSSPQASLLFSLTFLLSTGSLS